MICTYAYLDPGPVRLNYCFVSVHLIRILLSLFNRCAVRIIKITYYLSSTSSFLYLVNVSKCCVWVTYTTSLIYVVFSNVLV